MEIRQALTGEIVRGMGNVIAVAKGAGKIALKAMDFVMNNPDYVEQLIEEEQQNALYTEQHAVDYFQHSQPDQRQSEISEEEELTRAENRQNEFIALILARSICRELEEDPDAMVEEKLMKLKNIMFEVLPDHSLYTLGLSAHHHNLLSKRL